MEVNDGVLVTDRTMTPEEVAHMKQMWIEFERYMTCAIVAEPTDELKKWFKLKRAPISIGVDLSSDDPSTSVYLEYDTSLGFKKGET